MSSQAVMAGSSVVSFVPGVEPQDQIDIMNSLALAQLSADKRFNRAHQVKGWFGAFVNTLAKTGWIPDDEILDAEVPHKQVYSDLEEAALLNLQGIKQASLRKVVKASIESLRLDTVAQDLFETRSRNGAVAYYQFAPCESRQASGNYIYLSGMQVTTRRDVRNILFDGRTIRKTDVLDVGLGWSAFYLVRKDYDRYRDDVLKQLAGLQDNFFRLLSH